MKQPVHLSVRAKAPILEQSPFEAVEVVDVDDLSGKDRTYLQEREKTIDTGRRTFLEVGQALIEIRDYRGGLLYKRYGTFEKYCQERWEFGRTYAFRLMEAAQTFQEMLPRGNRAQADMPMLPTTEKQLRSLKRLPPDKRLKAWTSAVENAGVGPVFSRFVEREVRKLLPDNSATPTMKMMRARPISAAAYRISAHELEKIRAQLAILRRLSAEMQGGEKIRKALTRVEGLLPR